MDEVDQSEELQKLLYHENELIRTTTQMIIVFVEDVENGQLTRDEFLELVDDLTNLELIDESASSIENKAMIASAFESLKTALKALPFI